MPDRVDVFLKKNNCSIKTHTKKHYAHHYTPCLHAENIQQKNIRLPYIYFIWRE